MTGQPSICVHAHFYQPPREDPFTNLIPDEPGAEPFRNWNERILDTCYRPNAELGNYRRISFNLGPTLSSWMASYSKDVLLKITEEDQYNSNVNGAGNAIAQPYNHTILPLSNRRDKETQVIWGIEAFKNLFGRSPQGIWFPECAVDLETLNVVAEQGVQFTILAPWQVEAPDGEEGSPYRIELENGKSVIVFLYNKELSTRVSFDKQATENADLFAERLLAPIVKKNSQDRLTIIATDGELYGHHQIFRDKFLAHLLNGSTSSRGMRITYPGLWLMGNEVTRTARVIENTSWSCHHGVERWRDQCGCTADGAWKKPLREAFNCLADEIDVQFERIIYDAGGDPWEMRNHYIDVILGKISFPEWLKNYKLLSTERISIRKLERLFRAQYERQRMFTSCGWFFDSLDRIEPQNNISYAACAVWLMEQACHFNIPYAFYAFLSKAKNENTGLSGKDQFLSAYARWSINDPAG